MPTSLSETLLRLLASYGVCAVIVEGFPRRWLRRWKLFRCYLCLGFWVGVGMSLGAMTGAATLPEILRDGFVSAGFCYAVGRFVAAQVPMTFGEDADDGRR